MKRIESHRPDYVSGKHHLRKYKDSPWKRTGTPGSVLVAIGVSQDDCQEILSAAKGMKEDRESALFLCMAERTRDYREARSNYVIPINIFG